MSKYSINYRGEDQSLHSELRQIAVALEPLSEGLLDPRSSPPAKPQQGQSAYADGTSWNPGQGEGLYVYDGNAWVLLGGAGSGLDESLLYFMGGV